MKSITNESVTLSWNAPSDTGGYNTIKYIITVTPLDGRNQCIIVTTYNRYTVTRLMFGQRYKFSVRANNNIGLGQESNTVMVAMPGKGILLTNVYNY